MSQAKPQLGASTQAVHGGERQRLLGDSITVPIYQTSTYVFRNTQELVDFKEGRATREVAVERMAGTYRGLYDIFVNARGSAS